MSVALDDAQCSDNVANQNKVVDLSDVDFNMVRRPSAEIHFTQADLNIINSNVFKNYISEGSAAKSMGQQFISDKVAGVR